MESIHMFNSDIRVKEEPNDGSFTGNNWEMTDEKPDLKNFQLLSFSRESSTYTPQKCEENHESELDDEVEIVVECEDVKSHINSITVKKIDCSQNFL
ncbi:hypothetical protein TKK_0008540 [Trichogramma kaykai]